MPPELRCPHCDSEEFAVQVNQYGTGRLDGNGVFQVEISDDSFEGLECAKCHERLDTNLVLNNPIVHDWDYKERE